MTRTPKTWTDIAAFVSEVYSKEGARPNIDFFKTLANECLDKISELTGGYFTSWSNAGGGDLTLTGAVCPLPIDCLEVTSVEWNGDDNVLERTEYSTLDSDAEGSERGWRSLSGTPDKFIVDGRNLVLNSIPSGTVTGMLVVRGQGMYPPFSDAAEAVNPLSLIPATIELLPAHYILSELPIDPNNPASVVRQQRYERKVNEGMAKAKNALNRRQYERFVY
jgi:hypothetical protein